METLTSIPEFYIDAPLYVEYLLPGASGAEAKLGRQRPELVGMPPASANQPDPGHAFLAFCGPFKSFCLGCGAESVFVGSITAPAASQVEEQWYCATRFYCSMQRHHTLRFYLRIGTSPWTVMKVGQHPSLADVAEAGIRPYRGLLGEKRYREFNLGVRAAANGVGIGGYVYFRRVFEDLIREARDLEAAGPEWNEEAYRNASIPERITMLRHRLPGFVVRNAVYYKILSKAIHELEEEECRAHLPIVRAGIEQILDAAIAHDQSQRKEAAAQAAIQELARRLSQADEGKARD